MLANLKISCWFIIFVLGCKSTPSSGMQYTHLRLHLPRHQPQNREVLRSTPKRTLKQSGDHTMCARTFNDGQTRTTRSFTRPCAILHKRGHKECSALLPPSSTHNQAYKNKFRYFNPLCNVNWPAMSAPQQVSKPSIRGGNVLPCSACSKLGYTCCINKQNETIPRRRTKQCPTHLSVREMRR